MNNNKGLFGLFDLLINEKTANEAALKICEMTKTSNEERNYSLKRLTRGLGALKTRRGKVTIILLLLIN